MKIGILTYHYTPNIGATLQAFALQKAIQKLGYDCEIIDYRCENIDKREIEYHRNPNRFKDLIIHKFLWPQQERKIVECQDFIETRSSVSAQRYDASNIVEANNNYDILISGSDMIWNLEVNGYDYTYFLDFANKDKYKLSYASSIGGVWQDSDVERIKTLLTHYNSISMRESDSVEYVNNTLGLDCKWVCDPTMLLSSEEWNELVSGCSLEDYVLVYFPYKEILNAAYEYALKHDKKLVVVGGFKKEYNEKRVQIYNPYEWIGYFKNADAIFTDSYHGVLFSLYFEKDFFTYNESNRIKTLLTRFNAEDAYIQRNAECKCVLDYSQINDNIERFRRDSLMFLSENLANCEM